MSCPFCGSDETDKECTCLEDSALRHLFGLPRWKHPRENYKQQVTEGLQTQLGVMPDAK